MANPITWRTIGTPDFGSSNQLGIQAGNQITSGIDAISKAAGDFRQNQIANEDAIKATNTQNLMRQIQGFNDLSGYDSFQQRMQQELGKFNPAQVDFNKVNTVLEGRDNTLRTDFNERQEFNNKPLISEFQNMLAKDDFKGAENVLGQIGNNGQYAGELADAKDKFELERQTNLVSTDLSDIIYGSKNKQDAIANAERWADENNIVDPNLRQTIANAGNAFESATKMTGRQLLGMQTDIDETNDRYNRDIAINEARFKANNDYVPGSYQERIKEGAESSQWLRTHFNQNLEGDNKVPKDKTGLKLFNYFTNTDDSAVRKDMQTVKRTFLDKDTWPSNIDKDSSEGKVWSQLREAMFNDELSEDFFEAAKFRAMKKAMGAESGQLNTDEYLQKAIRNEIIDLYKLKLKEGKFLKAQEQKLRDQNILTTDRDAKVKGIKNSAINKNVNRLNAAAGQ